MGGEGKCRREERGKGVRSGESGDMGERARGEGRSGEMGIYGEKREEKGEREGYEGKIRGRGEGNTCRWGLETGGEMIRGVRERREGEK